jgi:hypothetical protein
MVMKNRYRTNETDRDIENRVIDAVFLFCLLFFCTTTLLFTLAGVACGPAARPVSASTSSLSPYEKTVAASASEQAGQLAAFYRENF